MIKTSGPQTTQTQGGQGTQGAQGTQGGQGTEALSFLSSVASMMTPTKLLSRIGLLQDDDADSGSRFADYEREATNLRPISGTVQMAYYRAGVRSPCGRVVMPREYS